MTEKELMEKLAALGELDEEKRNDVACALIGHSSIQSTCMGYFYCGRCKAQLGDQLASIYNADSVVIIGHNCDKCRKNYEQTDWRDRLFVPDPFTVEPEAA